MDIYHKYDCISATIPINTDIDVIRSIALLNNQTGVICGDEGFSRKIKSYFLPTGKDLNRLRLNDAFGLAEVKLGDKIALAVSHMLVITILCYTKSFDPWLQFHFLSEIYCLGNYEIGFVFPYIVVFFVNSKKC